MNIIRQFTGWVYMNPVRFTFWFLLSCLNGFLSAIFDYPLWMLIGSFAVIGFACYLDVKALAILLCVALGAQPVKAAEPTFEPAGMAGVAVVVVVVGGVTVYLLVRTCQKVFPKTPKGSTNAPPYVAGGGIPDCAGSWTYAGFASCYAPASDNPPPTVSLELNGSVEQGSEGLALRLSAARQLRSEELLSPSDFQTDLAQHGITFGEVGVKSYGRFGRPAYPEEVPIAFSEDATGAKVVTIWAAGQMVPVALERSSDLSHWTRIAQSTVPVGQRLRIVDSTAAGQMFYRLRSL